MNMNDFTNVSGIDIFNVLGIDMFILQYEYVKKWELNSSKYVNVKEMNWE